MSQYAQMVVLKDPAGSATEQGEQLHFTQALLRAADAPDIRKIERTRLRLLASMATLLSEGTELVDLRVADVVEKAGLAHGTFYRYFVDLPAAIESLAGDFAVFLYEQLSNAKIGDSGSRERVKFATLTYVKIFRANTGLMNCLKSLRREDTTFRKAYIELNHGWNMRMAAAIARRRGTSSQSSVLPIAYALGGMMDEFLTQLLLRKDPALAHLADNDDTVAELLTDLWCLSADGHRKENDN